MTDWEVVLCRVSHYVCWFSDLTILEMCVRGGNCRSFYISRCTSAASDSLDPLCVNPVTCLLVCLPVLEVKNYCHQFTIVEWAPLHVHRHTHALQIHTLNRFYFNYTVSQKTTLTLHTITSMHINRFRSFVAQILLSEYAIEWWFANCYPTSPN